MVKIFPFLFKVFFRIIYLERFTERYKSEKIERGRDLYDKVLSSCPNDVIHNKYFIISNFSEMYDIFFDECSYGRKIWFVKSCSRSL